MRGFSYCLAGRFSFKYNDFIFHCCVGAAMSFTWVCSTILIVLGTSAFILGIVEILKDRRKICSWHSAPGTVTGSRVVGYSYRAGSKGRTVTNYEPFVYYEYQVGETTYRSNRLNFSSSYFNQARARKIAESYPNGTPVTVYYDPADPYDAVLDRRSTRGAAYLIIGIVLLVLGYILIYR